MRNSSILFPNIVRKKFNLDSYIVSALRKIAAWWPPKSEALKKSKRGPDAFLCAHCGMDFSRRFVQVDHITPVVRVAGETTWDDYIDRLFCPLDNLQVLCKPCHQIKTISEAKARRKSR